MQHFTNSLHFLQAKITTNFMLQNTHKPLIENLNCRKTGIILYPLRNGNFMFWIQRRIWTPQPSLCLRHWSCTSKCLEITTICLGFRPRYILSNANI